MRCVGTRRLFRSIDQVKDPKTPCERVLAWLTAPARVQPPQPLTHPPAAQSGAVQPRPTADTVSPSHNTASCLESCINSCFGGLVGKRNPPVTTNAKIVANPLTAAPSGNPSASHGVMGGFSAGNCAPTAPGGPAYAQTMHAQPVQPVMMENPLIAAHAPSAPV